MKHSSIISATLRSLMRVWAISFGVIALVLGTCHGISKTLLPVILLALAYGLAVLMRVRRNGLQQACHRIAWVVRSTLILSAFVMFVLVLIHNTQLFGDRFNWPYFNPRIPYVTGLVVFTTGVLVGLYAMFMGPHLAICRSCRRIFGEYGDDSLASSLFDEESSTQLRLFIWICVVIAATQWTYFFLFFINVNYNSPDLFFFNFMPVAVYVLSLVYLGSRYYNISEAFRATMSAASVQVGNSELRFIVINGDSLLLREQSDGEYDTPYKVQVPFSETNDERARSRFEALGGDAETTLRYLYTNLTRGGERTFHYAAVVADGVNDRMLRGGRWMSLYEVDKMLHSGHLAPMLANELVRIYTITMAWKTYDRKGRRLYPVKHYRPLFRLRDFKEWDVDYDDVGWLQVANENEDMRFFHARRLWRKCLDIFSRR